MTNTIATNTNYNFTILDNQTTLDRYTVFAHPKDSESFGKLLGANEQTNGSWKVVGDRMVNDDLVIFRKSQFYKDKPEVDFAELPTKLQEKLNKLK